MSDEILSPGLQCLIIIHESTIELLGRDDCAVELHSLHLHPASKPVPEGWHVVRVHGNRIGLVIEVAA